MIVPNLKKKMKQEIVFVKKDTYCQKNKFVQNKNAKKMKKNLKENVSVQMALKKIKMENV